jgi:FkbM family methyltransferase
MPKEIRLIKRWIKAAAKRLGYEIHAVEPSSILQRADPFVAQHLLLDRLGIDAPVIFDIGANEGQTTRRYRQHFANAPIFAFEPYPASFEKLSAAFPNDSSVKVFPLAVSDQVGTATLYVNHFDPTHSLLPRPSSQRRYYPRYAGPKTTIEVEVTCIDTFAAQNDIKEIDILKLDIQGGELNALRGALQALQSVPLVYLEIAFVPHYENAPLLYETWKFLADLDYSLFNIYDLYTASNGQLRYGDALFIHKHVRDGVVDRFPDEP